MRMQELVTELRMNVVRLIVAASAVALCGCSTCTCVDISNSDVYGYRTWAWDSEMSKMCADLVARVRHYGWGARTQYGTNVWHRIEVIMYDEGSDVSQTNVLKRARYWIRGEREAE